MAASRGKHRSNVFGRGQKTNSIHNEDELLDNLARWETDDADALLDAAEKTALSVYRSNGLPDRVGIYCKRDDGWRLIEIGERPKNLKMKKLYKIGQDQFEHDSDVGYASSILQRVEQLRNVLSKDKQDATNTFLWTSRLYRDLAILTLEFGYDGAFGRDLQLQKARKAGGRAKAASVKSKSKPEHVKWQREAVGYLERNPKASKSQVAEHIVKTLGLSPARRSTIRQTIVKT